jgi:phosphatidylglycerophosphate synthase
MFVKLLRSQVKKLVENNIVLKLIAKLKIPPNFFSFLAIVLALPGAYFLSQGQILMSLIFIGPALAWDAIDGAYARTACKTSQFGAYIEGIFDVYVEVIIFLGLVAWNYSFEASLAMMLSLILSYAKPRVSQIVSVKDVDWPGIGGKFERRLIFFLSLIIAYFFPSFNAIGMSFDTLSILLYLLSAVVFIGGIQRIYFAKKIIEKGSL